MSEQLNEQAIPAVYRGPNLSIESYLKVRDHLRNLINLRASARYLGFEVPDLPERIEVLSHWTVPVLIPCLLCKQDYVYGVTLLQDGTPMTGICGPCNQETAVVVAAEIAKHKATTLEGTR